MDKKLYLRGDAAFASPDVYEYLEEKGILYAFRLKANNNLYLQSGYQTALHSGQLLHIRGDSVKILSETAVRNDISPPEAAVS